MSRDLTGEQLGQGQRRWCSGGPEAGDEARKVGRIRTRMIVRILSDCKRKLWEILHSNCGAGEDA